MLFNTTQAEFYQRLADLTEQQRMALFMGISLEAAEIIKILLPDEPMVDELVTFKRPM